MKLMETNTTIRMHNNVNICFAIFIMNECVAASSKKRKGYCILTNISHLIFVGSILLEQNKKIMLQGACITK